eukprot:7264278-Pyramimonas_sp.AAC.1
MYRYRVNRLRPTSPAIALTRLPPPRQLRQHRHVQLRLRDHPLRERLRRPSFRLLHRPRHVQPHPREVRRPA